MDFEQVVRNTLSKMIDDGKVQGIIEEKLKESIEKSIGSILGSYSEFGKDLKEQMSEVLKIDLSNDYR